MIVLQSCDPFSEYREMMAITARVNTDPASEWHAKPSTQWILHDMLKHDASLLAATNRLPRGDINYQDGRYIKQAIRASGDMVQRLEWTRGEVRKAFSDRL